MAFCGGKTQLGKRVKEVCTQLGLPCLVLLEQFEQNPYLAELYNVKMVLALDPNNKEVRCKAYFLSNTSELVFLEAKRRQREEVNRMLTKSQNKVVCLEADSHVDPIYAWAFWIQDLM